ncbi:MAG: hypothetical protein PHN85_08460 [Kiritimatiellae bacterium]|nr:hypothetical protein [Kiritimatiellia bacterium]
MNELIPSWMSGLCLQAEDHHVWSDVPEVPDIEGVDFRATTEPGSLCMQSIVDPTATNPFRRCRTDRFAIFRNAHGLDIEAFSQIFHHRCVLRCRMAVTASPLSQFFGNGPEYTNRPRLRVVAPRAGAGTVIRAALSTTSTLTAMRPEIPIA